MSTILDSVQMLVTKICCLFFSSNHKRFNQNPLHIYWLTTLFAGTVHSLAIESLNQSAGIVTTNRPLSTTNIPSSTLLQAPLNSTAKKYILKQINGNDDGHFNDHQNPTSGPSFNYYLDKNAHKNHHDGSSEHEPPPKRFQVAKFDFEHG